MVAPIPHAACVMKIIFKDTLRNRDRLMGCLVQDLGRNIFGTLVGLFDGLRFAGLSMLQRDRNNSRGVFNAGVGLTNTITEYHSWNLMNI